MKRIFTVLSILLIGATASAQEEKKVPEIPDPVETKKDTSEMRMNGKKIIIITDVTEGDDMDTKESGTVSVFKTKRNRVFQGFEIGFTGVSYAEGLDNFTTDVPPGLEFFDPIVSNSINWSINPFELDVRLVGEYVKFSTGLGYTAKNFTLANNYRLYKDADGVTQGTQEVYPQYKRNRFRTGYITIPAMLYFNSDEDPNRAFRIGGGVVFGTRIFEAYRLKNYADGHKLRENYNGGFNANPIMLDLRAIVGVGGMNFYATYSLEPLFNPSFGPQVYPFTIGIAFVNNY